MSTKHREHRRGWHAAAAKALDLLSDASAKRKQARAASAVATASHEAGDPLAGVDFEAATIQWQRARDAGEAARDAIRRAARKYRLASAPR